MKKVLIVEDHADIRRLVRLTLEFEDCEVFEAGSALEGLAMATAIFPDLILLDVMMPGEMDGLELCRRVKGNPLLYGTKVVMLSARGSQEDLERGEHAGADAYLIKPFSPLKLVSLIDDVSATIPLSL
ncbi:N/A [soil metagenome]